MRVSFCSMNAPIFVLVSARRNFFFFFNGDEARVDVSWRDADKIIFQEISPGAACFICLAATLEQEISMKFQPDAGGLGIFFSATLSRGISRQFDCAVSSVLVLVRVFVDMYVLSELCVVCVASVLISRIPCHR